MVTIYAIKHIQTGKRYIGCTAGSLNKRMREHRCLLRAGTHAEPALQEDWSREGESAFSLETLEVTPDNMGVATKREAELRWMRHYQASGALYNTRLVSFQPPPGASSLAARRRVANGYRPSSASNLKRKLAQLGRPKGHGAKISATKQRRRNEIVCSHDEKQA